MEETAKGRWDGENMRTAATRLRKEEYEHFKLLCELDGESCYETIRRLIRAWMAISAGDLERPFDS